VLGRVTAYGPAIFDSRRLTAGDPPCVTRRLSRGLVPNRCAPTQPTCRTTSRHLPGPTRAS